MTCAIDLNCDMGESFGAYTIGRDAEIINYVSSANIACGFHAGDPQVMHRTVALAAAHGVAVGAHVGFPDLVGFGRRAMMLSPEEVRAAVLYQLGALAAFCRAGGVSLHHVKPHGAMYNMAVGDRALAEAIAGAVAAFDPGLILYALPGSALGQAGEGAGLAVAYETFADRAFNRDGSLVSRNQPGALITDPELAVRRVIRMVREGLVEAIAGEDIPVRFSTICVHGDGPNAVELARAIRMGLAAAGIEVRSVNRP